MNRIILSALTVALLAACSGKVISVGVNAAEKKTVDAQVVLTTVLTPVGVAQCAKGLAHANICCPAVAGQSGPCVTYVDQPFHVCDRGWDAYPDAAKCCDLKTGACAGFSAGDDPNVSSPGYNPDADPSAPPPRPQFCGYQCKPGWYTLGANACCLHDEAASPDAKLDVCESIPSLSDPKPPVPSCGPNAWMSPLGLCCSGAKAKESGQLILSCAYSTPVESGPRIDPSFCPECPSGWSAYGGVSSDNAQRGVVCCGVDARGQDACFSQAGILHDGPISPDTPSISLNEAPRACSEGDTGSKLGCSCSSQHAGHIYAIDCTDITCTCRVDAYPIATFDAPKSTCGAVNTLWSSGAGCGFP